MAELKVNKIHFEGEEVEVKNVITLRELIALVGQVAEGCFVGETRDYHPEVEEFLIRTAVVSYYTNFKLPEDTDDQFVLLFGTDFYNMVVSQINEDHLLHVISAVKKKVNYMASSNVERFITAMSNTMAEFDEIMAQFTKPFEGITPKEIEGITKSLSNFNMNDLVKAVMDAKLEEPVEQEEPHGITN